ncbi:TetR/AcrR family transcriptional regulator [Rhizobium rhizophilum]|uniref:TetR/AcrR family transcriptional regulator n=1 Tax=Rhizobium rhizophilum TaxID=1850373 RepID=A0ABY2QRZ5_9HYPH|nr:TetR/AcrR family transcriptional regulator [Rhizobium rhizophilum]THV12521.1 TetR/AcrR family transcriptional regulator [Rhizobium rhizophilum]
MALHSVGPGSPRKIPVQSRSEATVDAIYEGAIQVLVEAGPRYLTTTRVAERAGVSVGTLYQYFANIDGLMAAILERHLGKVMDTVARICKGQRGQPLLTMVQALADGFIDAKSERLDVTQALYAVAYDLKGLELIDRMTGRSVGAIRDMLESASDVVVDAPDRIAAVLHATLAGTVQIALNKGPHTPDIDELRHHMRHLVTGYLGSLFPQVKTGTT